MNFTILSQLMQAYPIIMGLMSSGLTPASLVAAAPTLVPMLTQIGASLFPKAAPEMHAVAAVMATFDPNKTKWLQGALNQYLGINLVVDGSYGPLTTAAVKQAQTKLLQTVDGWAGGLTNAALKLAIAKM